MGAGSRTPAHPAAPIAAAARLQLAGVTVTLQETRRLTVRTVAVPDPGTLLDALPGPDPLAWVRRGDGLVGWGEALRIEVPAGPDRAAAAQRSLWETWRRARVDDRVGEPGTGPVAFGSLTFDDAEPGSVLIVPSVVLGRRNGHSWLTTIGPQRPSVPTAPRRDPIVASWHDGALPAASWQQAVAKAVAAMRAGAYGKVVLARDLYATTVEPIDVRVLLDRLATRFPDCYTYSCDGLVGSTPELYIRRFGDRIISLVLAGTIPRSGDPATDAALGERLMHSAKDAHEHRYAVESARAALAPLCRDLQVPDDPELLSYANVRHLGTRITGTLAEDRTALEVTEALHPTAAVGGAPTDVAVRAIAELEGMHRGRYAGPVGWLDSRGNGEWGIALRCAQISGNTARLLAGCGIVADSDPAAELAEAQAKFDPVHSALTG